MVNKKNIQKNNVFHYVTIVGRNKDIFRFAKFTGIDIDYGQYYEFAKKWGKEEKTVAYSIVLDYTGDESDDRDCGIIEIYFQTENLDIPIKKYEQWIKRYPSLIINWECNYESEIRYYNEEAGDMLDWNFLPNRFFLRDIVKNKETVK